MTSHYFNWKKVYIHIYRQKFLMYKFWLPLISAFFILFSEDILGQNEPMDTVSVIEDITHPKDSLVHNPRRFSGKWNSLSDSLFLNTSMLVYHGGSAQRT